MKINERAKIATRAKSIVSFILENNELKSVICFNLRNEKQNKPKVEGKNSKEKNP